MPINNALWEYMCNKIDAEGYFPTEEEVTEQFHHLPRDEVKDARKQCRKVHDLRDVLGEDGEI